MVHFIILSTSTMTTPTTIDYFKRLSLEETFSRLFHVFAQRWGVFLSISMLAYLVIWVVIFCSILLVMPFAASAYDNNNGDDGSSSSGTFPVQYFIVLLIDSVIYYAIMCVADGAIIRAVAEIYVQRDRATNVHDTLKQGLSKFGPLFCTAILIGMVTGIPSLVVVLAIVYATGSSAYEYLLIFALVFACFLVWVSVVTYHIYPSIMVENQGIMGSITRSFELSKEHRCYIFTTLLIFAVVKFVLAQIFQSIGHSGNHGALLAAQILRAILNIFFASFGSM